jgi:hypothetical protein
MVSRQCARARSTRRAGCYQRSRAPAAAAPATAPGCRDDTQATISPSGFGDGVTYLAWGPGLIVEVARGVALQLDVDGATHVRNIAKGPTVRFGLSVSR